MSSSEEAQMSELSVAWLGAWNLLGAIDSGLLLIETWRWGLNICCALQGPILRE